MGWIRQRDPSPAPSAGAAAGPCAMAAPGGASSGSRRALGAASSSARTQTGTRSPGTLPPAHPEPAAGAADSAAAEPGGAGEDAERPAAVTHAAAIGPAPTGQQLWCLPRVCHPQLWMAQPLTSGRVTPTIGRPACLG